MFVVVVLMIKYKERDVCYNKNWFPSGTICFPSMRGYQHRGQSAIKMRWFFMWHKQLTVSKAFITWSLYKKYNSFKEKVDLDPKPSTKSHPQNHLHCISPKCRITRSTTPIFNDLSLIKPKYYLTKFFKAVLSEKNKMSNYLHET